MDPDIGDLPFAVELKLQLSELSFGQHEGMGVISPPSDFSELDTLGAPVFSGRCFFGSNNLGVYPDKNFGIIFQRHDCGETKINDGILGRVFRSTKSEYSFARVYAEDEARSQVEIFLIPNVFEKIYLAKSTATFQLVTSFNEHKRITEDQFRGRDRNPDRIIVDGAPGLISSTKKFTFDIGEKEFGEWWLRVRLVSLGFSSFENISASKN